MRVCRICNIEKELVEFHKHTASKEGRVTLCKKCANALCTKRYNALKENPEKFAEVRAKYNANKKKRVEKLKKLYKR